MLKRLYTLFIIIAMVASSTIKAEDTVYQLVVSESKDASVLEDGGVYLFAAISRSSGNYHLQLMSTLVVDSEKNTRRFSPIQIDKYSTFEEFITIDNVNENGCPYEYTFRKVGNDFKILDVNNKCIKNIRVPDVTNNYASVDLAPEEETDGVLFTITRHDSENNKWKLTNKNSNNQTACFADATTTTSPKQLFFTCVSSAGYVALYKKVTSSPNPPSPTTTSFIMSNVGYATLYYGTKDVTLPAGLTASTYTLKNTQDATYLTPSHTYIAGDKIPAGEAVVVKGQEGNYSLTLSEHDETLSKDASNILSGFDDNTDLSTVENASDKYFYKLTLNSEGDPNSVGFYWAEEDGAAFTTQAHKAYLAISKSVAAKSIVTFLDSDNQNTTGLVEIKKRREADAIYDLSGKHASKSGKGIKIEKGKKYLMR